MLFHNKVEKRVTLVPSVTQGLHANICWYLKGRRCCKILNPWYQPLLFPRNGQLIAYPLYKNHVLAKMMAETGVSLDELASNIIFKMSCAQIDPTTSASNRLATRAENSVSDDDRSDEIVSDNDILCSLMKSAVDEICWTTGVKWQG